MMGIYGMDSFLHILGKHNDVNSSRIEVLVFSIDIPHIDRNEMVLLQQWESYLHPLQLHFHLHPSNNHMHLYRFLSSLNKFVGIKFFEIRLSKYKYIVMGCGF